LLETALASLETALTQDHVYHMTGIGNRYQRWTHLLDDICPRHTFLLSSEGHHSMVITASSLPLPPQMGHASFTESFSPSG
jgi:hypothetical protein